MKKLFLILLMATVLTTVFGQAPQKFNYQAIVRDNSGSTIASQTVSVRISIHDGSAAGTVVYQETHTVSTNQFGLMTLEVGWGTSTIGSFSGIDWSLGSKYLQTEIIIKPARTLILQYTMYS